MKKTLIIGSTVVDIILSLPHLPHRSEDINIEKQHMQVGGCAYNVAHLLRQFHLPFTLFSPIGSGMYGDYIREQLSQFEMDIPLFSIAETNGACYCLVEADGERSFLSHHGAEYRFKKQWFSLLDHTLYDSAYLCGLEIEEDSGEYIIDFLEHHFISTLYFAPGPRIHHLDAQRLQRLFDLSVILHLNEQEAREYTKATSYIDMARKLYHLTHNVVIITLGAKGAFVYEHPHGYLVESASVTVIDTIGAGDAHLATIIATRKQGKSFREATIMANHIAAQVTTCHGSILSDEHIKTILSKS